ncbi:alpha/beta hydrolase [Sphingorhabdus arenilitoris]|uniref:Alpha/beta hydrolase n=1 Tax=Sphingorhabdus arenilitoris TaxID=1490041 RepID=A0ABV8RCX9_9SPHN
MLKYIFWALVAGLAGLSIYFYFLSGPQKLDFADRWYPGGNDAPARVHNGLSYGTDERQKLDVYTPARPAPDGETRQVLIFFHGGSWRDGERAGYAFLGRSFAARGIITVIADYRKIPKVRFPAFVEDGAAAVNWTVRNISKYGGDANQIFVMGHSAGAHIAMMSALDPQWLAQNGLKTNVIKGVIGLAGPYDFLPFDRGSAAEYAMGSWKVPAETQPITYARTDAPPLLLLTGDADTTVKPRNSRALDEAMRKQGGTSASKIYPGVDHTDIIMAVARPFRNKAPVISDTVNFMRAKTHLAKHSGASAAIVNR